jgi:hypothetical protein
MMIFNTVAVVLGTLLSSTHAASSSLRRTQATTLGNNVLAMAKNYTLSNKVLTTISCVSNRALTPPKVSMAMPLQPQASS